MTAPADKRQYERHPIGLDVTFEANGKRIRARSRDISLGGMFVETTEKVAYGTALSIEIKLPSLTEPAVLEATVRWAGADGMGVQFGSLRTRETWAINQLVRT